jgi:hypothetical protein
MGERSLNRWRAWNAKWGEELYHEDGFLVMSRDEMQPGGFEHDSHAFLRVRGHQLRRTSAAMLRELHPAWNHGQYRDGYLNPIGGWVESGRVIAKLAAEARAAGIEIIEDVAQTTPQNSTALAALALPPAMASIGKRITSSSPPVRGRPRCCHICKTSCGPRRRPCFTSSRTIRVPSLAPQFPVWGADIGKTGWYGFPANADGLVKVANHGPGRRVNANDPRSLPAGEEERYRSLPARDVSVARRRSRCIPPASASTATPSTVPSGSTTIQSSRFDRRRR